MIVGTAGHIDHGKTSLVKALTGVDTDRLKEEKARGISIELGYAYQPLEGGEVLGFVDVPGHEKFIDHMVAGATGIEFVLLVVAADDGVMPQTIEHLDIVRLLGVTAGAVAMTKIDRCDAARLAACEREIRALLAATPLAGAPIFPLSSVTGDGIDALRAHLYEQASARRAERPRAGAGFRLAVDRCFTLGGIGTVVTGTVFAGAVKLGDEVRVTPSGIATRVRSIHAQNRPAETGRAGERCALALAGVAKDAIERGEWVVAPHLHVPTARLDARIVLSAREQRPLKHWTSVHLHLGAAHVMARVALLDVQALPPGGECLVQLVTDRPIGALAGDAVVLRDAAATRTLGGGRVLDPFAPARRRKTAERLEFLRCTAEPDASARLAALLERSAQGVDLAAFLLSANLDGEEIALDPSTVRVRESGIDRVFTPESWAILGARLLGRLADYHLKRSDELGPDLGRIRRMWFPQHAAAVVAALAERLLGEGRLARSGPWWHLPEHSVRLTAREETLAQRVLPMLENDAFDPPWVRDLARAVGAGEQELRSLMQRLTRRGEVFQVVKDLFYARAAVAELARIAKALEDESGAVRAAQFRDRIGIGRKRAIQILEFFDRVGYTRRSREDHRIRGDNLLRLDERAGEPECRP
jgi:selenocysteine-specific elongation factor